jgi:hypothetical protein
MDAYVEVMHQLSAQKAAKPCFAEEGSLDFVPFEVAVAMMG